jgi:hypothetical protein
VFSLAVPDKGIYYLKATASVPCQKCTPARQTQMQIQKGMRTSCGCGSGRGRFAAESESAILKATAPEVTALSKAAKVCQLAAKAGACMRK